MKLVVIGLGICQQAAAGLRVPMPLGSLVHHRFQRLLIAGGARHAQG